jgi:hypothetical protein
LPLALVLALLLTFATALGAIRIRSKAGTVSGTFLNGVTLSDLGSVSYDQLEAMLDRLVTEPLPDLYLSLGAMCYDPAAPPEVSEYVCPVCGEKTIYGDFNTRFVEWELQGCRRIFDEIDAAADLDLVLDETRFCQDCTPGAEEEPRLYLTLVLEDRGVVSSLVDEHDLRLLESFLKGRLFYTTWNDAEEPLKPHAGRIRELLGLPAEEELQEVIECHTP